MSKDFKEGEYYVFNDTKKKAGKATIHALVQVDGELHAVLSYDVGIKRITVLPVEKNEYGLTVIRLGCGVFLNSDAPVLPKPIKFQIGKAYKYKTSGGCYGSYTVTAKYTDGGTTYIVLDNKDVAKVSKIGVDDNVVEYADFLVNGLLANKTLKEIEE